MYDEKFGHKALPYFEQHPNDWSDELTGRCWIVDLDDITLVGHNNVKKVIDDKYGHEATLYFIKHPDDWNDQLNGRCRYVHKDDVKLTKK